MKKISIYLLTIILGISIPVYFLLIWEPLKAEETLSDYVSDSSINDLNNENNESKNIDNKEEKLLLKQNNAPNSLFDSLEGNRRDSVNIILKKLSINDLIKVNNYFSDKDNKEKIEAGIELVKKRLSYSDYEVFKDIIKDKVNSAIL